MSNIPLASFVKRKDFLICVDSDGCAIDNLEAKHRLCFGPCLIREWNLQELKDEVLPLWMETNVFGITRGIPRFQALSMVLEEISRRWRPIPGLSALEHWVDTSEVLNAASLAEEADRTQSPCLKKALHWNEAVNQAVRQLAPEHRQFFEGVEEALRGARQFADIVVVSGANREAVLSEWTGAGLSGCADGFLCQEQGSKASCIAKLKREGYAEDRVLMIGDSPSDRASAELNGVCFFPVLAKREVESWRTFPAAAQRFWRGSYRPLERQLSEAFMMNLSGGLSHD